MPSRIIKESITTSESLSEVSADAERLFWRLVVKAEDWTSNRVIRVLDGWANDVARIFGDSYIGKVTNSDTGRQLFKADLVSLALQYQDIDAISDFVSEDITIQQGNGKRDVAVDSALKPNDSMEKLYMTTVVN